MNELSIHPAASPPAPATRFIGIDAHKHYLTIAAATRDTPQAPVLLARRLPITALAGWAQQHLSDQDAVVLEASTNTWTLHDELLPFVHSVTVAHPPLVRLIARAHVKTDQRDAKTLARLHAAGLIPAVWVPPIEVRELRGLLAHRSRLIRSRTQATNRLHAVLHRYHLAPPDGELYAAAHRTFWDQLPLSPVERLRVRQDLALIAALQPQIAEAEQMIAQLAASDDRVILLVQLPGIGLLTAMTILAAIGDITRFPTAKKLVGYAGLGVRLYQSGQNVYTGRITKAGRRDLRWTMIEAAWVAVEHHPHWRAEFQRLVPRLGDKKAIVAIARKLLVVVWHVLTEGIADRHAQPDAVARKLYAFAETLGRAGRQGQTVAGFTRAALDRLGLGREVTTIQRKRTLRVALPPSALDGPSPG